MTATDPFTTPAEAEREARAKQAQDFLALAAGVQHVVSSSWDGQSYRRNYGGGVEAVRDAIVGQGYALLTVQAELADIAASLRALASAPNALAEIGREIHDLTATVDQGVEFADSTAHGVGLVVSAVHELVELMDRPRWWQRRRRRALGAVDTPAPLQEESTATEVYEFRVDVRYQVDPWASDDRGVLASARFHAEPQAARDVARGMLPDLCAQADIPADPDQVYGRVSRCDRDGAELCYVDGVFLPGATVLSDPPGGF